MIDLKMKDLISDVATGNLSKPVENQELISGARKFDQIG
jgi:hypothetical protein